MTLVQTENMVKKKISGALHITLNNQVSGISKLNSHINLTKKILEIELTRITSFLNLELKLNDCIKDFTTIYRDFPMCILHPETRSKGRRCIIDCDSMFLEYQNRKSPINFNKWISEFNSEININAF